MPTMALPLLSGGHAAGRRRGQPSSLAALCCAAVFFFMLAQVRMLGEPGPAPRALAEQGAQPTNTAAAPPLPPSIEQVERRALADNPPATPAAPLDAVSPPGGGAPAEVGGLPASLPAPDGPADVPPPPARPVPVSPPPRGGGRPVSAGEASDGPADDASNVKFAPIENANKAVADGRLYDWAWHLNMYLDRYGITPLHVWERPGPLFSRLTTKPVPPVDVGPLVTVIMVAFNAEDTVEYAVNSILHQTWRSLELVIVDDASEDRTWTVLTDLGKLDARIRLVRNPVQVGPYISRNRVLTTAAGAYITTQDADDWSLPGRLETQIRDMVDSKGGVRANMVHMLRVQPTGLVSTAIASSFAPDGVARQAFVSAMYEARLLREDLGFWDSVRYGADGEMIRRAQKFLGAGFNEIETIGVFLADRPNSLGKQGYRSDPAVPREPSHGWVGSSREAYRAAYDAWHADTLEEGQALYLPFPLRTRPFSAPPEMVIGVEYVCACLRGTESECEGEELRASAPKPEI